MTPGHPLDNLDNWVKHQPIVLAPTATTYKKFPLSYTGGLLRVRWARAKLPRIVNAEGEIEAIVSTPHGRITVPPLRVAIGTDRSAFILWPIPNQGHGYKLQARHTTNLKVSTKIEIWEYIPPMNQSLLPIMSGQFSTSVDLSAMVAAQTAQTGILVAINDQLTTLPDRTADATQNNRYSTEVLPTVVTGNAAVAQVFKVNQLRVSGSIQNTGTNKVRLFLENPQSPGAPSVTTFQTEGFICELAGGTGTGSNYKPGDRYEFDESDPRFKGGVWAISDTANGRVSAQHALLVV